MLHPSPEQDYVVIQGGNKDWQVLWNDGATETWVGLTEKMKEQLCWCYCYLRQFNPKAERIIPWGLERFSKTDPDTLLMYTMMDRRLRAEGETPPEQYYAWRLPMVIQPRGKEEELILKISPSNDQRTKFKIRLHIE
jgi:hypothetical protein